MGDVTEYGRLDQDDLVFALRIMHLEPSHSDLEQLMKMEEPLIDRCAWVRALTNSRVLTTMMNNADQDQLHLSEAEKADLSKQNMDELRNTDALHLNGPLSGKFKENLHKVGLDKKFDLATDTLRHQFHMHTNHYAGGQKKAHTESQSAPVGNAEISDIISTKKVVV